MSLRIAINGFGRIGRSFLRAAYANPLLDIVAINDPNTIDYLAYALKFDSVRGSFSGAVEASEDTLVVDGKKIEVTHFQRPEECPWRAQNVDLVVEASGRFLEYSKAEGHIKAGAGKVLITASTNSDIPMFVMGVNHENYDGEAIFSNASCTTNCVAIITDILNKAYGIEEGLIATIHATTSSQKVVDSNSTKSFRDGRSVFNNIIPSTTGATKSLGYIIPELENKLMGISYRVPVNSVCAADINCRLKIPARYEEIRQLFKDQAATNYYGTLGFIDDEVVSSDMINNSMSAIFDAKASQSLNDNFIKIVSWYDNEWGYSNRIVDLILFSEENRK